MGPPRRSGERMGCAIQAGRGSFEAIAGEDLGGDVTNNVVVGEAFTDVRALRDAPAAAPVQRRGIPFGARHDPQSHVCPTTFLNRSSRQL